MTEKRAPPDEYSRLAKPKEPAAYKKPSRPYKGTIDGATGATIRLSPEQATQSRMNKAAADSYVPPGKALMRKVATDIAMRSGNVDGVTGATPKSPTKAAVPTKTTAPKAPAKTVNTKGGAYPVYERGSEKGKSFNTAFGAARKSGKSTFEWEGRSYNTKKK